MWVASWTMSKNDMLEKKEKKKKKEKAYRAGKFDTCQGFRYRKTHTIQISKSNIHFSKY